MADSSHYPRLYRQKAMWQKVVRIEREQPAKIGGYHRWTFVLDCGHRTARNKVTRRAIDGFDLGTLHVVCRRCIRDGKEPRRVG